MRDIQEDMKGGKGREEFNTEDTEPKRLICSASYS